jgi:hypothetical protein
MRSLFVSALLAAVTTAACRPEDPNPVSPPGATGRLRFVHASPDTARARNVNVRIDGTAWLANQPYKVASPYVLVLPGARQVDARKTQDTTIVIFSQPVSVAVSTDFTLMTSGIAPDLAALVLTDDNAAPAGDNVRLRVVHASPGTGAVDVFITIPSADLATETPDATNLGFRAATAYVTLPIGSYRVRWTTPGTTTVLGDTTTASLTQGQVRTVVMLDRAGGGTPSTYAILSDR